MHGPLDFFRIALTRLQSACPDVPEDSSWGASSTPWSKRIFTAAQWRDASPGCAATRRAGATCCAALRLKSLVAKDVVSVLSVRPMEWELTGEKTLERKRCEVVDSWGRRAGESMAPKIQGWMVHDGSISFSVLRSRRSGLRSFTSVEWKEDIHLRWPDYHVSSSGDHSYQLTNNDFFKAKAHPRSLAKDSKEVFWWSGST